MTKAEKADRRAARKQAFDHFRRVMRRPMGLYATNGQLDAAARKMVDKYFADQGEAPMKPVHDWEQYPKGFAPPPVKKVVETAA